MIVAGFGVFQVERQFSQINIPVLRVYFAGQRQVVDGWVVLHQVEVDFVNVGQLVAFDVYFPVVGIAFGQHVVGPGGPFGNLPGGHHRPLGIVVVGLGLKLLIIRESGVILG